MIETFESVEAAEAAFEKGRPRFRCVFCGGVHRPHHPPSWERCARLVPFKFSGGAGLFWDGERLRLELLALSEASLRKNGLPGKALHWGLDAPVVGSLPAALALSEGAIIEAVKKARFLWWKEALLCLWRMRDALSSAGLLASPVSLDVLEDGFWFGASRIEVRFARKALAHLVFGASEPVPLGSLTAVLEGGPKEEPEVIP